MKSRAADDGGAARAAGRGSRGTLSGAAGDESLVSDSGDAS